MAEKKSVGHAYNIDFLNVVFAASSIALFVCTVWMVWDDFDREWKNTQRRFRQLEMEVTRQQLEAAEKGIDTRRRQQLEEQLAAAQQAVDANRDKVAELESQIRALNVRLYRESQDFQFAKATYDVDRYAYEAARNAGESRAERMKASIDEQAVRVAELNLVAERTTAERDRLQAELAQYTGKVAEIQKQIDETLSEQRRLQARLAVIAPSLSKTLLRDAPMTDFMAPTLKVQQIVLPDVVDDVNFTRVPKMDRCTTCHLAIDRRGYENYPQPFTTHPNLAAYVGSDSPHPLSRVGCTVCHDGMGQSVTFKDVAHTPRDEKQEHEWVEQHGWAEPHYWDYPMLPAGMTEASCAKCHREEAMVPEGPTITLAYATYERAGCYACHKTRGFEELRKPGPSLTKIDAKLSPEWVKNWIREPKAIKPATWMPQIWYNSNSNAPEDAPRNEAEIEATVAYLFANTEAYRPAVASPPQGNAASGKAIVESVGCLGCHVVDDERSSAGPRRTFGQPLQALGSKTSYAWIYNWVRDPKHYSPDTYMPDLRLTDREAADVATYLYSLKGGDGTSARAAVDQKVTDAVLLDYLKAVMPSAEAEARLAAMSVEERQLDLGSRVIGRYGCFSCHDISGFEKAQAIGVELSEEASKLVTRLDFAFVKIPHTKLAWFNQKLHDPRSFDQGRVLMPLEKLRMPDYHLSDRERQLLTTAIMSFQRQIQPPAALPAPGARREFLRVGRNLTSRRNCVGCHTLEGVGGDYQQLVAEPTLAPPLLTPEGAKVQPDWLYAFLRAPITIRPWLDVRMPTFGMDDGHWNEVIQYFQAIPGQIRPFRTVDIVRASTGSDLATGRELFELLRCQQCHVLGAIPKDQPTANLAPDLRMAAERLNPEWVEDWLRAPLRIQPGTRMPAFWPNYPKSDFPQLGSDGERQIRAIRDYMFTFRGGPSPKRPASATVAAPPN